MKYPKKAPERWETKIGNSEVTPQAVWPIAKSLIKRDGPNVQTSIYSPLGLKFRPLQKANAIADCLENQFAPHDLCDENHERRLEARVQALHETVDNNPPERIRLIRINKFFENEKGMRVGWHSKRMPQALSEKAIGISTTFD
jgi:hypothetical protein